MRFGISERTLGALSQKAATGVALSDVVRDFDRAGSILEHMAASRDLSVIELHSDLNQFWSDAYGEASIARLQQVKTEYGLTYTCHLPLWSIELASLYPGVREGSVQDVADAYRRVAALEPETFVVHATGALASEFMAGSRRAGGSDRKATLAIFQDNARRSIELLLKETGMSSRALCVETVEFPAELTFALAEEYDLSVCFDTGHVLVRFSGDTEFFETLEMMLPRIAEIHLHDGTTPPLGAPIVYQTDHQQLGTGHLDIPRFFDRLTAANYQGPIVFELPTDKAVASLEVIRGVRPEVITPRVN
jgi:sugar phosphate isomerase/epimerase